MGYTSPLQEILEYPAKMPETLKMKFNMTITEYAMLHACDRDLMHSGLAPTERLSENKRIALRTLHERGWVDLNLKTGKWETNSTGSVVLLAVTLCIHQPSVSLPRRAAIIPFPHQGNSA